MKTIKCSNECEISLENIVGINPTESQIKVWESLYMDNINDEGICFNNYLRYCFEDINGYFFDSYHDFEMNMNMKKSS